MDSVELCESEKSPSPNQLCTGALALAAQDSEGKKPDYKCVFSSLTVASEEERNR